MDKRYQVIFLDLLYREDFFKKAMTGLGISPSISERIIRKAPVVLKADMSFDYASRYADAVRKAGGRVRIQECVGLKNSGGGSRALRIEPLKNFTMCPHCGHKQLKAEACVRCGSILKDG